MTEWLIRAYFAANALLYGAIAVKTTLDPDAAASKAGYRLTAAATRSEFLTTYAGLLIGVAAMFAVFAFGARTQRVGLTVAIALYAPIVAYRLVPALLAGGRYSIAVGATAVEAFMLVGAVALLAVSAGPTG